MTDPGLRAASALGRSIASTSDPSAICGAIAETAVTALAATVARVWVNDAALRVLTAAGSFGGNSDAERSLLDVERIRHGTGVPGRIVLSRAAEFIADASDDARWVNRRYIRGLALRAYVGLPLIAGDDVVGVLSILFDARRDFTDDERALAGALADCAAITLRTARLYQKRGSAEALEAVNLLGLTAAHELNNPLAVILGQSEILKPTVADRPQAADRLRRIQDAARRIARVVRQMNRIVRLETHKMADGLPVMLDLERCADSRQDPPR